MKRNHIVIEGNIGSGKTELGTRLAREYNARLLLERKFVGDGNPSLQDFYLAEDENKHHHALPMELNFLTDRYDQQREFFDAKGQGPIVSDYSFPHKSKIFGAVNIKGNSIRTYEKIFHILKNSIPHPDIIVYIHREIEECKQNIFSRNRENENKIKDEYLKEIQDGYFDYFERMENQIILILNISGMDFINNEIHYKKILAAIEGQYPVGITRFSTEEILALDVVV